MYDALERTGQPIGRIDPMIAVSLMQSNWATPLPTDAARRDHRRASGKGDASLQRALPTKTR
jgi:hypothetical protein